MPPMPTISSTIQAYVGTWGSGQTVAGSTTISNVVFPILPGQTTAVQFTAADVGCPIMIVGAGPAVSGMPPTYQIQGATLKSTIVSVIDANTIVIADTPSTSYYNTGFRNIAVFREIGMQSDSWNWQSSITQSTRDTFDFTAFQSNAYFVRNQVIVEGQPVYVRSTDAAVGDIFGGLIYSLSVTNQPQMTSGGLGAPQNPAGTAPFAYIANCTSWDSIATRRRIHPEDATTLTGTVDSVFRKIALTALVDEGIDVSGPVGPVITIQVTAGALCSDLLDKCATLAGTNDTAWNWKFDSWRNVWLRPSTATPAPWDVDQSIGSDDNVLASVSVTRSHDQLANAVYGLGSSVRLGELATTFYGNGAARTFNMPSALNQVPSVTLNGGAQTVGILGVDTGKNWYWSQNSAVITQDAGGAVLTSGDTLVVQTYTTQAAVALAYDNANLAERAIVEGPGYEYDGVLNVSVSVDTTELLTDTQQYAIQQGSVPQTVSASTLRGGLAAGQMQHIRLDDIGVDDDYLITTVKLNSTGNVLCWSYKALRGYAVPNYLTAFTQFINRQTGAGSASQTTPSVAVEAVKTSSGNYATVVSPTDTITLPQTVQQGNLVAVLVMSGYSLANPVALTDSLGNTYYQAAWRAQTGVLYPGVVAILYCISQATGICTITGWRYATAVTVAEIEGIDPDDPVNTWGGDNSAPTLTTDADGCVIATCISAGLDTLPAPAPTVTAPEFIIGLGEPVSYPGGGVASLYTQGAAGAFTSSLLWPSEPSTVYASVAFNKRPNTAPPSTSVSTVGNPSGTVTHTAGALTAGLPVIGNGNADLKVGTKTGSSTEFVSAAGSTGSGKPLIYDGSGNATGGDANQLIPAGGVSGQVLTKTSSTNYAAAWIAPPSGTHSEPLTDGNSNFIFGGGDIIVAWGIPN